MIVYKRKKSATRKILGARLFLPDVGWKRYLIYLAGLCILILVAYFLTNNIIMPLLTRHGSEFALPNIVGMTIADAEPVLQEGNLQMEITSEEYHPDKPTGTILTQFPTGGTKVKEGRIVKVVISLGQKSVEVPDLRGFSIRQARLNLEAVGFHLGDLEWTLADSLPEKVVVFSYPRAGTLIPYGSAIDLMVNRGPYQKTVFVPRLIGLSLSEARMRLEEKGLKVGLVTQMINENYLPETVLEQSEETGTELLPDEEVDLVISITD